MFIVFLKAHSFRLKRKKYHLLYNFVNKITFKKLFAELTFRSNHVTSCPNVLKLNYIDSKKSDNSCNTNINDLGTMRGPISMLRTLNTNENIDLKCWGLMVSSMLRQKF